MKITKSELAQIIKEEADRFLKIKALKEEKAKIEKALQENYSAEEEKEEEEETNSNIEENEEVLATSVEESSDSNEMNEEEVLATSVEEGDNIEEGMFDWFSKTENKEQAKTKMIEKLKEMINSHEKMSQSQKESLLKQADKIAEGLLAKGNAIFKKEPKIQFYPRQNSYAVLAVDAAPSSPWVSFLQTIVKGASEDLKGRGLSESIRKEVERLDKIKELKVKADLIIDNLKKL